MSVWTITCASCGDRVAAIVVAGWPQQKPQRNTRDRLPTPEASTLWLRCPSCGEGSVKLVDGRVFPSAPAGRTVKHLPEDVARAWQEARTAHAVGAYTASEMMCRKILMHVAVDKEATTAGRTFVEYIDALKAAGYLTTGTEATVDKIRTRGNGANHELPASTEADSHTTLGITEHLLVSIYEIPNY